ncbi:ubinuclein-1-like [Clinocottus analis]|uniref:ubinuclein-1-like n=1 Tax=Clinocottus analis TaxID=304258 RepID=UPI0035C1CF89
MAEYRRVQLTTLSPGQGPSFPGRASPSSAGEPDSGLKPSSSGDPRPEVDGPDPGTVRLELALFEADESSCPEFNYTQLVDNKLNGTKEKVPLNIFKDEELKETDEVAAISRKLEKIYGGKPKEEKKKEDRIQDLIDIGFGYDDEDSFIDNSEAYDEFVPASLTTIFGGFYVNSGVLHFRQVSDAEGLATDEEPLESPKKHKVNGGQDEPKKKRCREVGAIITNVESSTLSENGSDAEMMVRRKKRKSAGPLSVTSMLKKFQKEKERRKMATTNRKNATTSRKNAAVPGIVPIPLCPADAGGGGSGLTDPLLSLIGSTNDHALIQAANAVDFDIDLDSLLDVTEQTSSPTVAPRPATEAQLFGSKADDLPEPDAGPRDRPPSAEKDARPKPHSEQIQPPPQSGSSTHPCVPLPEGLPPRLEDSIRKLMAVVKTSEGESKLKFFTPEINSVLLDIELQCREQGVQLRSKVYTHLSSFLPCSRETLLKRVKKLFLAHREPPDVDDPMQKLKEAIGRAMPEQIARFNEECRVYEQVKASKATEEEKEGKQKVNVVPEDNPEEKCGRRGGGGPRKSFKWNEEIRRCLCEVLKVRMERYEQKGSPEMEMELHVKTLLENEVQPLWPKGWMQCRVLIRESRKMLNLFTSLPLKPARSERRQPSLGGPLGCSVPGGPPPLKELPQEADDVIIVSSNVSSSGSTALSTRKEAAAASHKAEEEEAAVDAGSSTPAEANRPPVKATPAPTRSLLDLLADQALARDQPHSLSQELLAAAVAKYKRSVRHWSFGSDTKSPPLPPPPPQSSPVGFPLTGLGHGALPQLLQVADFARHMDASHVQIISDDDDVALQ